MAASKEFVSAQMDSSLVRALGAFAKEHGITRSAAVRLAVANLVGQRAEGAAG